MDEEVQCHLNPLQWEVLELFQQCGNSVGAQNGENCAVDRFWVLLRGVTETCPDQVLMFEQSKSTCSAAGLHQAGATVGTSNRKNQCKFLLSAAGLMGLETPKELPGVSV